MVETYCTEKKFSAFTDRALRKFFMRPSLISDGGITIVCSLTRRWDSAFLEQLSIFVLMTILVKHNAGHLPGCPISTWNMDILSTHLDTLCWAELLWVLHKSVNHVRVVESGQRTVNGVVGFSHFNWVWNRVHAKLLPSFRRTASRSLLYVKTATGRCFWTMQAHQFGQISYVAARDEKGCLIKTETLSMVILLVSIPIKCCRRCQQNLVSWRSKTHNWADFQESFKSGISHLALLGSKASAGHCLQPHNYQAFLHQIHQWIQGQKVPRWRRVQEQ